MPWLPVSPGQKQRHWLCEMNMSLLHGWYEDKFQLPIPDQCREMLENANMRLCFLKNQFSITMVTHWPSDAIWQHRTGSTQVQVMACCLTAPSHYLIQCWLVINIGPWHSSENIIIRSKAILNQPNKIENCILNIAFRSPRDQWVNAFIVAHNTCAAAAGHTTP